jgi:hypothetical protein
MELPTQVLTIVFCTLSGVFMLAYDDGAHPVLSAVTILALVIAWFSIYLQTR